MNTYKFERDIVGWQGIAKLYSVDPPLGGFTHVIVSAVVAPFSGPETYIFGCDADGANVDYSELDGSYRGGLDHATALLNAGYEAED